MELAKRSCDYLLSILKDLIAVRTTASAYGGLWFVPFWAPFQDALQNYLQNREGRSYFKRESRNGWGGWVGLAGTTMATLFRRSLPQWNKEDSGQAILHLETLTRRREISTCMHMCMYGTYLKQCACLTNPKRGFLGSMWWETSLQCANRCLLTLQEMFLPWFWICNQLFYFSASLT